MIDMYVGLGIGLVFFITCVTAYTLGIKHGKAMSNNNVPTINLNPVKTFKEYVESKEVKKEEDLILEGLNNIFTYTGDPQAKEGEK